MIILAGGHDTRLVIAPTSRHVGAIRRVALRIVVWALYSKQKGQPQGITPTNTIDLVGNPWRKP